MLLNTCSAIWTPPGLGFVWALLTPDASKHSKAAPAVQRKNCLNADFMDTSEGFAKRKNYTVFAQFAMAGQNLRQSPQILTKKKGPPFVFRRTLFRISLIF
jgi:hypothetical protein